MGIFKKLKIGKTKKLEESNLHVIRDPKWNFDTKNQTTNMNAIKDTSWEPKTTSTEMHAITTPQPTATATIEPAGKSNAVVDKNWRTQPVQRTGLFGRKAKITPSQKTNAIVTPEEMERRKAMGDMFQESKPTAFEEFHGIRK